jgi:NAD(P)H-hydrate epimerase
MLPPRPVDSYKGRNGHVLVIAGSRGMSGAGVLAALGALKAGAGLVTLATPVSQQSVVTHLVPEALSLGLPESSEGSIDQSALEVLEKYIQQRTFAAVAIGPGLSTHSGTGFLVKSILGRWNIPMVLDADGLNVCEPADLGRYGKLVITPHPGEFARLLGQSPAVVKKEGAPLAQALAREQSLVCLLKGHQSLVTDGQTTWINTTGNAAMGTGGMGDVLTGIIGSFLAQGLSVLEAAAAGMFIHGRAGDLATLSDRGLLARELAQAVPLALQSIGLKKGRSA